MIYPAMIYDETDEQICSITVHGNALN